MPLCPNFPAILSKVGVDPDDEGGQGLRRNPGQNPIRKPCPEQLVQSHEVGVASANLQVVTKVIRNRCLSVCVERLILLGLGETWRGRAPRRAP
jgi:hypothetical protein